MASPSDLIGAYRGHSERQTKLKCKEAYGGVLFIDEAYMLLLAEDDPNSFQKQVLITLLEEMDNNADKLTVIFAGYTKEIQKLFNANSGLASRIPRIVEFEDYTEEELLEIFLMLCKKERFTIEEDAVEFVKQRISMAVCDENFGNGRTISNIFQQIKTAFLGTENKEIIFTVEHVKASLPEVFDLEIPNLIGMEDIKKELIHFRQRAGYVKCLMDNGIRIKDANFHMLFTGNPGTGKTTVAKMIAEHLYRIGVLKTNKLVCAERKDLVDGRVGFTEKKDQRSDNARNGRCFIY